MNERHAPFIWISYGLTVVLLLWNLLAPWLKRNELHRTLSEDASEIEDQPE